MISGKEVVIALITDFSDHFHGFAILLIVDLLVPSRLFSVKLKYCSKL